MTTININLLPEELRDTRGGGGAAALASLGNIEAAAAGPIALGVVAGIVLAATPAAIESFYLQPRAQAAQEAEDAVKAEIDKYQVTLNQLKGIADNKEYLRAQLNTLQNVAGAGTSWGDILDQMRAQTPGNLWFSKLSSDPAKGTISIDGAALDYGSVAYFHRNLDHSEYFYEPILSKTSISNPNSDGVSVVTFTMDVKVRLTKTKT